MKKNEYDNQQDLFDDLFPEEAQPSSPSPEVKEQAPVCNEVDVTSLIGTLNTTGHAKLSEHTVKKTVEKAENKAAKTADDANIAEDTQESEKAPSKAKDRKKTKTSKEETERAARKKEDEHVIATDGMAAYLKEYLDKAASENAEFAKVYANPKKSIKECVEWVCSQIFKDFHKAGICSVRNDAVEGLALHYYQEEDCKPDIPQNSNIAMAVLLQGFPVPAEDFEKMQSIARKEQRKTIIESEKKKYAEEVRSGKVKLDITAEEQAEIDAAARQALIDASAERQKKNTNRISQAKPKEKQEQQSATLF